MKRFSEIVSLRGVSSFDQLVERGVRYCHYDGYGSVQRWVFVGDFFCIGSTSAIALCKHFNLDPDELLYGVEDE